MKKVLLFLLTAMISLSCESGEMDDNLEIRIPVSVQEIKPGKISEFVSTTGTVQAIKTTIINSLTEGAYYLQKNSRSGNPFAMGDEVTEGDLIIRLVNPEYENTVKIESHRLNLDISEKEFEKQKSLYEKGGVTLRELRNAERSFIDARYLYENAVIQLEKLKIRAPFEGKIVDLPYYTPGVPVLINMPMVRVMNYRQLYAEVQFPANALGRITEGQSLRATHYNLPQDTINGYVKQVSPAIDQETRTFKAMVVLDNPADTYRPGMFVKIETIVASRDSAIVIPKDIILAKRKGRTVYIVDKGAAIERVVTSGIENESNVEVIEGLAAGERLVVKGFETLRNGSRIKIVR